MKTFDQSEERTFAAGVIIWLVNSASLLLASVLLPGIIFDKIYIAFAAGLAMSAIAFLIEPVLYILTLPINLATFGTFTLFLNGIVLLITARCIKGFYIKGPFWTELFWAIAASLFVSFFRMVVRSLLIRIRLIKKPE